MEQARLNSCHICCAAEAAFIVLPVCALAGADGICRVLSALVYDLRSLGELAALHHADLLILLQVHISILQLYSNCWAHLLTIH